MKLQLIADDNRGTPLGTAFTDTDTPSEEDLEDALEEIAKQAKPILLEWKEAAEQKVKDLAGGTAETTDTAEEADDETTVVRATKVTTGSGRR